MSKIPIDPEDMVEATIKNVLRLTSERRERIQVKAGK
jgi:hypothetical protein